MADSARQKPDNTKQVPESARQEPDNTKQVLESGRQVSDNTKQVLESARQVSDNTKQVFESARQVSDNTKQVSEITRQKPDNLKQVPESARQSPVNTKQVLESARQKPDNTKHVPESARQKPDNTKHVPESARQKPENTKQVRESARQKPDNTQQETDNANVVPDNNKKNKRRRRKNNKGKRDTEDDKNLNKNIGDQDKSWAAEVNKDIPEEKSWTAGGNKNIEDQKKSWAAGGHVSNSGKDGQRKGKKKRSGRRGLDRYYGRFQCRVCRRTWDSAHVFTVAGTKKVVFKQRCKNCDTEDAWVNPHGLELLRCSVCGSQTCECTCDECDTLIHRRYVYTNIHTPEGDVEERKVDDQFEYCTCPENKRRSKAWVGANIDTKKPHLAHLCQKCLRGFPCNQARSDEAGDEAFPGENDAEADQGDNEP